MGNIIKIGCVNIDTSHPQAFARCLMNGQRARYHAVYNDGFRSDAEVDFFVRDCGLAKRCGSLAELAEISDVGFIHSCNWDLHLSHAMPFIKAGKPVFIDKPVVGSLDDCEKLQALSDSGAVIFGGSSMRYVDEIRDFLAINPYEKGEILNVYGTVGVDDFNYAIHIVEALMQVVGRRPLSCQFISSASPAGILCDNYSIRFQNDVTAEYTVITGIWQPWVLVITTTKGVWHFKVDHTKVYDALLDNICDQVQYGRSSLVAVEEMVDAIKILLACKCSKLNNSIEVSIDELPREIRFDGTEFARQYAAAAAPLLTDNC